MAHAIVRSLRQELDQAAVEASADTFAFLLIDGLCKREEVVLSAISSALGDIPLFGGSSSGRLTFQRSYVFDNGRFETDAAVLMLVRPACHSSCSPSTTSSLGNQDGGDRG